MRRVVAISVFLDVGIVVLLLYSDIKDFLWTHPWWHSFLVAMPGIAALILAWFELQHSREANELRTEANNHRIRANTLEQEANGLRAEQAKSLAKIGEVQVENTKLQAENVKLQAERNEALGRIAANTQRPPTEAETNARILKKHIGHRALVTENKQSWGSMGAIVAEVNENNILTLFMPSGIASSEAWGQPVRCDKLHVVEEPTGACAVQINIIERYGSHTSYGVARTWDERHVQPTHAGIQRGANVFNAQYRKNGSSKLRHINIYSYADGSPNYIMVTMEDQKETNSWYSSKLDIEKKFAVVQVEWADQGYRHDGGGGDGTLNLFIRK